MAERTIRIRVVAAADPSLRGVFRPLEQEADRVYQKLGRQAKRAAGEREKAQGSPYRQSGRAYEQDEKAFEKAEKAKTQIAKREQAVRDRIRDSTFHKMQVDEERAERRSSLAGVTRRRQIVSGAKDFGRGVVGPMGMGARAVMGGVGEIARGAGIDPSLGGLTGRVMSTEGAAMRATLSGQAAKGKVATGADVAESMQAIRAAGDATASSYTDMATALENFTSKSSDLAGGKTILADLGKVAKASGVDLSDLALGAGAISASMEGYGDSASEAARKSKDLMMMVRMLAKQGAMGSVEIKDLATYMPRLAASAGKFSGNYADNLGELGAVAQMAMKGGRSTAAEATNSSQALARDLSKRSNLKYLSDAGIDPFADKGRTKLRSVSDIVTAVYAKTKGDQAQISSLFRNEMSRSAINAFSGVYQEAGGGEAGLKAIRDTFKNFSKTFTEGEVNSAADLAIGSKAGQAQSMQNRFETAWAGALEKIAPAMERMAPHIGKVADGFASLVSWMATNPGEAITVALLGSIAKAGIGAAVSSALTKYITGGGPAGPGAGPGGGGALGALGAGLTITAAAVTITAAGVALIDAAFDEKDKADTKRVEDEMKTQENKTNLLMSTDPAVRAAALAESEAKKVELQKQLDLADQYDQMPNHFRATSGLLNYATAGDMGTSWEQQDAVRKAYENRQSTRDELAEVEENLRLAGGPMKGADWVNMGLTGELGGAPGGFGGPGISFIDPNAKPGAAGDSTSNADVKASVDALSASIKGGIRVNNLSDIKIPSPDPSRTGPDAIR